MAAGKYYLYSSKLVKIHCYIILSLSTWLGSS